MSLFQAQERSITVLADQEAVRQWTRSGGGWWRWGSGLELYVEDAKLKT
jgi:hypothetical protein